MKFNAKNLDYWKVFLAERQAIRDMLFTPVFQEAENSKSAHNSVVKCPGYVA